MTTRQRQTRATTPAAATPMYMCSMGWWRVGFVVGDAVTTGVDVVWSGTVVAGNRIK